MSQAEHHISCPSFSQTNSISDLSRQSSRERGLLATPMALSNVHTHWCTICENPPSFQTCDGWKRHEKEQHENAFICMPYGPVETEGSTSCCSFCGVTDPDEGHLSTHDILQCTQRPIDDRRFCRKIQLIKHLKAHGIRDGSDLAEKWHISYQKCYYSCGFCVSLFTTNAERLNHIDIYHWRYHHRIEHWDKNLVIRGLLLQPHLLPSWHALSACDPRITSLAWGSDVVSTLQSRLELSHEEPDDLAAAAFYQSTVLPEVNPAMYPMEYASTAPTLSHDPSLASSWTDLDFDTVDFDVKDTSLSQPWPKTMEQRQYDDHTAYSPKPVATVSPHDPSTAEATRHIHTDDVPVTTQCNARNFSTSFTNTTDPSWQMQSPHSHHPTLPNPPYCQPPNTSHFTTHCSSNATVANHGKSPSIVAQMKRRLSRPKLREPPQQHIEAKEEMEEMDLNIDDIMYSMREHQGSRSAWRRGRSSS